MAGTSVSGCADGKPWAGTWAVQKRQAVLGLARWAVLRALRAAESQVACPQLLWRVGQDQISPPKCGPGRTVEEAAFIPGPLGYSEMRPAAAFNPTV